MEWITAIGWLIAALLAIPLLVLALECLAAVLSRAPRPQPATANCPDYAVLIPAHNEALGIGRTLAAVANQRRAMDRVIVVADNCTDATATVARVEGAEVVERFESDLRGKGYALAFGRDALRSRPPTVVIVLDADCTLGEHALERLARAAALTRRPAQGVYRMEAPAEAGPERHVAAFAFLVKNVVRPTGLARLGLPCLLTGTGMAFPWSILENAPLAHGHIVEDMGLAVDLAVAGSTVLFVPDALIRGEFPIADAAAQSQRKRWEHGHLQVILESVPRLLKASLRQRRPILFALALEIGVPPVSALMLVTAATAVPLAIWGALSGSWGPAIALSAIGGFAALTLAWAWLRHGRSTLPPRLLARVPIYALRKIAIYGGFLSHPQKDWVRTDRDGIRPENKLIR